MGNKTDNWIIATFYEECSDSVFLEDIQLMTKERSSRKASLRADGSNLTHQVKCK